MASDRRRDRPLGPDARNEDAAAGAGAGSSRRQLSHELKTPLNAILGNTELLLDGSAGPLSAQARACVVDIQGAGQSLHRRHQTLLLLVQALSVEQLAATRPVDLRLILEQLCAAADRADGNGRQTLRSGTDCLWVQSDPYWLEVLARTLVNLRREATAASGPLQAELSVDGRLRVGWLGFDPARLEASGLALVERIMALHGGTADHTAGRAIDLVFRIAPGPDAPPAPGSMLRANCAF
jgi:signal transduction histidine kinase